MAHTKDKSSASIFNTDIRPALDSTMLTISHSPTNDMSTVGNAQLIPRSITPNGLRPQARNPLKKLPPQNGVGFGPFGPSQPVIIVSDDDAEMDKEGLVLKKLELTANRRLRPIACQWEDEHSVSSNHGRCDAVLASYALYRKHLDVHRQRALVAAQSRDQPGEIFLDIRCGWQGCSASRFLRLHDLRVHCEKVHLPEIRETYCPFKGCEKPSITRAEYSSTEHYRLPGHSPVSQEALRVDPTRFRSFPSPATPPPIDPDLRASPFLATVSPYRAPPIVPDPATSLKIKLKLKLNYNTRTTEVSSFDDGFRAQHTEPEPLEQIRQLIVPKRGEEYFEPFCNDAPSGCHSHSVSYSIFKHPLFRGELLSEEVLLNGTPYNLSSILRGNDGAANTMDVDESEPRQSPLDSIEPLGQCAPSNTSLIPQPRPDRPWAIIYPDAFSLITHSGVLIETRKRKREEVKSQRASKAHTLADAVSQAQTESIIAETRLDWNSIQRAARRYATKTAGRSYGARYQKELYAFLKRGRELGEM